MYVQTIQPPLFQETRYQLVAGRRLAVEASDNVYASKQAKKIIRQYMPCGAFVTIPGEYVNKPQPCVIKVEAGHLQEEHRVAGRDSSGGAPSGFWVWIQEACTLNKVLP